MSTCLNTSIVLMKRNEEGRELVQFTRNHHGGATSSGTNGNEPAAPSNSESLNNAIVNTSNLVRNGSLPTQQHHHHHHHHQQQQQQQQSAINIRKIQNKCQQRRPVISLTHLLKRPPIDIEFTDLSYAIYENRRRRRGCTKRGLTAVNNDLKKKTILTSVDGKFKSGQLTGIMGPSGAGKSTLMNILAGYKTSNVTGLVSINGKERNLRHFRKMSAYIMQDDCLSPNLTTLEAMHVSANLKLGGGITESERRVIIDEILDSIGLLECTNTYTVNLSGGQRKRLSIALELINNPPVMFFDEPTSGLDSSSCFQCICLLKSLALGGRTVICTIHQPSARLFEMFDALYMLAAGRCIYKGPVTALVPFLAKMGLECPSYHNPADYVMEVACGEHGDYQEKLVRAIKGSSNTVCGVKNMEDDSHYTQNDTNNRSITKSGGGTALLLNGVQTNNSSGGQNDTSSINATCETSLLELTDVVTSTSMSSASNTSSNDNDKCGNGGENKSSSSSSGFPTSGLVQFWILLKRTVRLIIRDKSLTRMRLVAHFIIGILLGLIYYDIGNKAGKVISNAGCLFFTTMFTMFTAMMPTILTFPMEMSVFIREHLNYWYSLKSYYFAKTLADIPFQVVLTTCYVMGVYYLTSQPLEAKRFAMVLLISVLTALVSQSLGLLIGAAFNIETGVFLGPISTIPLVLFSGFFANLDDIPVYLRWVPYVSYVKYSFEGMMIAIYGLNRPKMVCEIMYCHFKYPDQFLKYMAMKSDMFTYGINVMVLSSLFIIFRILTYFMLRIKLHQNR